MANKIEQYKERSRELSHAGTDLENFKQQTFILKDKGGKQLAMYDPVADKIYISDGEETNCGRCISLENAKAISEWFMALLK